MCSEVCSLKRPLVRFMPNLTRLATGIVEASSYNVMVVGLRSEFMYMYYTDPV